MYGYESSMTLATDRLHYKYRPSLLSETAPQDEEQNNCLAKLMKKKNLVTGPKGVPDTKIDRLTSHLSQQELNSTQLNPTQ
jgi:hypothetical protein